MSTISVLIVVDVVGALTQPGGLQDNVYLVDTTGYVGLGSEGIAELKTACKNGDTINWRVTPVAPDTDVSISSFVGVMVTDGICVPTAVNAPGGVYWSGVVQSRGVTGQQQYTAYLSMDGKTLPFDPFLEISA